MTGTLIRKIAPHQKRSSSSPPTTGPTANPLVNAAVQTPIAALRCAPSANMPRSSASVDGASVAPPTPSSALASTSSSAFGAYAASTEAAPNAAAPVRSSRRRPMRSPSAPIVSRRPAIRKP
jgi:hypothetical protein